jgi:hypothetical protein
MRDVVELAPVVKTLDLAASRETAFEVFVGGMGGWWPLATHTRAKSALGQKTATVVIERLVGGRVFERLTDGEELDWGVVLVFDPPARFAMSWRLGHSEGEATTVELRFESLAAERCRVTLTHRDWERLGDAASTRRGNYDKGWDLVFADCYRKAVEGRT